MSTRLRKPSFHVRNFSLLPYTTSVVHLCHKYGHGQHIAPGRASWDDDDLCARKLPVAVGVTHCCAACCVIPAHTAVASPCNLALGRNAELKCPHSWGGLCPVPIRGVNAVTGAKGLLQQLRFRNLFEALGKRCAGTVARTVRFLFHVPPNVRVGLELRILAAPGSLKLGPQPRYTRSSLTEQTTPVALQFVDDALEVENITFTDEDPSSH